MKMNKALGPSGTVVMIQAADDKAPLRSVTLQLQSIAMARYSLTRSKFHCLPLQE